MDAAMFRKIMGQFATGVSIVTTKDTQGRPAGLTINALTSVSLEPLLVLFCIAKSASALQQFLSARAFAVNILAAHQKDLSVRFATKDIDRFSGIPYDSRVTGAPVFPEVLGYMECKTADIVEAGDHFVMLGEVLSGECRHGRLPLLFFNGQFMSGTTPAA